LVRRAILIQSKLNLHPPFCSVGTSFAEVEAALKFPGENLKRIMMLVYGILVVGLSITARAQETNIHLTNVTVDKEAQMISIEGHFPTPCVKNARVKANLVAQKQIELLVVGDSAAGLCIQILGKPVSLVIDAANIKYELSRSGSEVGGVLQVVIPQADVSAEFDLDLVVPQPQFSEVLSGRLEAVEGGFVLHTHRSVIKLASPVIRLRAIAGQHVVVAGHFDDMDLVRIDLFKTVRNESKFIVTGLTLID